jgi:vacuolar-type H+-ATPase subunit D/Vma8
MFDKNYKVYTMSKINPSRSELRTLKTKAQEGVRIAKQNLDKISMIRDCLDRSSEGYKTASECYKAVYTTYEQQEAVLAKLTEQARLAGHYGRKSPTTEK